MTDIRVGLHDYNSIPDRAILEAGPNGREPTRKWPTLNLADPQYAVPPEPPAIAGILYNAKRHVLSGPQESAKTLIAYYLLLTAIRQGHSGAIIDLEMGPVAARRMLADLGATEQELTDLFYTEPQGPPTADDLNAITSRDTQYALIDAAAGAFDTTGLDDNSRKDAEKWAGLWIQPLFKAGISTITLDHVTKNADTRGKYAIGSERKTGGADVHLGIDTKSPLRRGHEGIYKLTTHKDRGGYLQRGGLADIHLASDPDTHKITVQIKEVDHDADEDNFRPTHLMEKVSRWLEDEGGRHSGNQIEKAKLGKTDYVRQAIKCLVKEGFLAKNETGRGYEYSHILDYREADDLAPEDSPIQANPDLAPTSPHLAPDEVSTTSPLAPPSIEGGEVERRSEIDVFDPAVQAQLEDDDIPF